MQPSCSAYVIGGACAQIGLILIEIRGIKLYSKRSLLWDQKAVCLGYLYL